MAWKLPVAAAKEYGPGDNIYIYDADKKAVLRLNQSGDPAYDYMLACDIADVINTEPTEEML